MKPTIRIVALSFRRDFFWWLRFKVGVRIPPFSEAGLPGEKISSKTCNRAAQASSSERPSKEVRLPGRRISVHRSKLFEFNLSRRCIRLSETLQHHLRQPRLSPDRYGQRFRHFR